MSDLTPFPNGLSSFGMPILPGAMGSLIPPTTGKVFFVCSLGGASGSASGSGGEAGTSPDAPFLTLAAAQSAARASKGDVVIIMPGHAETISAASGITLSKAGVAYIGMGWGTQRATFTLSATASTMLISGANVTLRNVIFTCSIDEVVTAISVTGAGAIIDRVDYTETATFQLIQFLLTAATATGLIMSNCYHQQITAPATAAQWISLIGTDRAQILSNTFLLTQQNGATAAVIGSVTTAPLNIVIAGNRIVQLGGTTIASAILLVASTSGLVTDNRIGSTATSQLGVNAIASCYGAENYVTNAVNKSGILDPVADT